MSDQEDFQIWISEKNARIIMAMSDLYHVSLEEATDVFYGSQTAQLIHDRVADLHCRSEKYLATEVWNEHMSTN